MVCVIGEGRMGCSRCKTSFPISIKPRSCSVAATTPDKRRNSLGDHQYATRDGSTWHLRAQL